MINRGDGYIKMLNDTSILNISFASVQSKKGLGGLKRFQGRLKQKINNIGMEYEDKKAPLVWDELRKDT